jgi:hypothetical protein
MKIFVFTLLTILSSCNLFAAQSLSTKVSNHYYSIRALGMGNAFTAVADDYSLMFYNPAGLARKPYNEFQLTLVGAGVSSKTLSIFNDLKKAGDTVGTDTDKANAIDAVLQNYYGQTLGGKLQALEMFWVRKGWGIALIPLDLTTDMSINRQLGPALDLNVKADTVLAFGYGRSLNNEIDLGATFKFLNRASIEQSLSAIELAADSNVLSSKRFKEGQAIDLDFGVMWTPNWFVKKTSSEPQAEPVPTSAVEDDSKTNAETTINEQKTQDSKTEELKTKTPESKPDEPRAPQSETNVVETKPEVDTNKTNENKTDVETQNKDAEVANKETVPAQENPTPAKPEQTQEQPKSESNTVAESDAKLNQGTDYPLTLGATVHNVIGGNFSKTNRFNKDATEAPTKLERVIDLGAQYRLVDWEDFKIRAMLDIKNIMHPGITLNKMWHTGVELDYSPGGWFRSQLRAGVNQGYFTAGATLMLLVVNLEVATYGEEVGSESNKIENRVVAAKVGFNF